MVVVKGGVWTNIEDEILKASVSKYGLNQWARVSSLLARKTAKQCKARWAEWLDPGIRKIEWAKDEDEKLLHLAKLMPTQWRTIAPIVGRTATQCLERYQKLLDEAEARENDDLKLGGPEGGENKAPNADDVRKLRPGELDPDPESKPARPDTIDLDEDEKEMLSEARARLANTQGKKAKRKARERQLEDSRRMTLLQKRRELKNAGINVKISSRKPGQMDYNTDIPFEKRAASGFYDTREEFEENEKEREEFDPRNKQLATKRKADPNREDPDAKKRKADKEKNPAVKAAQLQRIREAEQTSKRRPLNLLAPQVGDSELEGIVKMGLSSQQVNQMAVQGENEVTRGLISNYEGNMVGATPVRTPRAPPQEDHIANEIRNIRALTETQSSLLGGENTPLHEGSTSTGFEGIQPRLQTISTPNPMATPVAQTGATPMRTPRDNLALNQQDGGATPQIVRAQKSQLRTQFTSLPKPKELDFELEMPEETDEVVAATQTDIEDAAERDHRAEVRRKAAEAAEFQRRSQVMQRNLPRPRHLDIEHLILVAKNVTDPTDALIAQETAMLIARDSLQFRLPDAKISGAMPALTALGDDSLAAARLEIAKEVASMPTEELHPSMRPIPQLALEHTDQGVTRTFEQVQKEIVAMAEKNNAVEQRLSVTLGGYQKRANTLHSKIREASSALKDEERQLDVMQQLAVAEAAALLTRTERQMQEVSLAQRQEREAQELYRESMAR